MHLLITQDLFQVCSCFSLHILRHIPEGSQRAKVRLEWGHHRIVSYLSKPLSSAAKSEPYHRKILLSLTILSLENTPTSWEQKFSAASVKARSKFFAE